ncbi:MAG TPA: phosphoribosylglycinamide formyltransferase [Burkholderiales bacterium]|nr:phosphoribosylglycinamide formyltransferase [Burkholderiales bacterium]
MTRSIVILISGRGSNMEALIRARLPCRIAAVLSNNADAAGLAIARASSIETCVIDHRNFPSRSAFDAELASRVEGFAPDLVVLAGFMRVLTSAFIDRFPGRIMNIHPSLLPAFPGLHTHRRALEAGVKIHGATVHLVTPGLDDGPIIVQSVVPVLAGDDEQTLAARVLEREHRIYPQAVRWFIDGRLSVHGGRVVLAQPRLLEGDLVSPALDAI